MPWHQLIHREASLEECPRYRTWQPAWWTCQPPGRRPPGLAEQGLGTLACQPSRGRAGVLSHTGHSKDQAHMNMPPEETWNTRKLTPVCNQKCNSTVPSSQLAWLIQVDSLLNFKYTHHQHTLSKRCPPQPSA